MPIYTIEGEKIKADSKEAALRIYSRGLEVTEEKEEFDEPLKSLDLDDDLKKSIVDEGDERILVEFPFCVIHTTRDREVTVRGFKTEKALEKDLIEEFEDPDGSGWNLECVIKNGKVYHVKAQVKITYREEVILLF
jgi:hypothetical protein